MTKTQQLFTKVTAAMLVASLGIASASAAALTGVSDTLSSAKVSNPSNHSFVFTTPTGIAAGSTTMINFPQEFGIPPTLTFADVDINDNGPFIGSSTLAAAPSGATLGVLRLSSTTLQITNGSGAIVAGHTLYIRIGTNATNQSVGTVQILNATTTGNKLIGITGSSTSVTAMADSGTTTVNIITDDTVQVSALVTQSLTFSISSNSINFGTLSSGSAKYASSTNSAGDTADTGAHNLAVSTNAPSGYTITVQGQTLTSQQNALNTINAIGGTPATFAVGTEQFGIYATKSGGTNGTIATPYATASSFGYNATATSSATFASGTSATATETYVLHYLASIAALTEAGTYSANLVYVGTSNF